MKIIHLQLEGFTCYKKKVEIDFSDLELFAMTGPTGAGKSSLVDAIIFALYGKVPRLSTDMTHLISQNKSTMNLILEFAIGEQRYRVGRKVNRKKTNQASLDHYKDGEWQGLAFGIRQVQKEIIQLISIDYEAFTKCIVLPQGDFAKFLQDAKGRQDIMIKLLGLEILGKIQKKASQQYEECKREIAQIETQMEKEMGGVHPDKLDEMKQAFSQLGKQIQEAEKNCLVEEKKYQEQKQSCELKQKYQEVEKAYQKSLQQQENSKKLEKRIETSQIIATVESELEDYEKQYQQKEKLQHEKKQLEGKLVTLRQQYQECDQKWKTLEKEHQNLPQLEKQIESLHQWQHKEEYYNKQLQLHQQRKEKHEQETTRFEKTKAGLHKVWEQIEKSRGQAKKLQTIITKLEEEKEKWEEFREVPRFLETLREYQLAFESSRDQLMEVLRERQSQHQELQELKVKSEKFEEQVDDVTKELKGIPTTTAMEKEKLQLQKVEFLQNQYHEIKRKAEEIQSKLEELRGDVTEKKQLEKELQKQIAELEKILVQVQKEYEQQEKRWQEIKLVWDGFPIAQENFQRLQSEKEEIATQISDLNKNKKSQRSGLTKEQKKWEKAKEELQKATQALEDLMHKEQVQSIRQHLHKGDDCPVCNQQVKKVPEVSPVVQDEVNKRKQEKEALDTKVAEIERSVLEKENNLKHLEEEITQIKKRQKEQDQSWKKAKKVWEDKSKALQKFFPTVEDYTKVIQLEEAKLPEKSQELHKTSNELDSQRKDLEHLTSNLAANEKRLLEETDEFKKIEQEEKTTHKEIEKALKGRDLEEAIQELEEQWQKRKALEEEKSNLDKAILEAKMKIASGESDFEKLEKQQEKSKELHLKNEKRQDKIRREIRQKFSLEVDNLEEKLNEIKNQHEENQGKLKEFYQEQEVKQKEIQELQLAEARGKSLMSELDQSIEERAKEMATASKEMDALAAELKQVAPGTKIEDKIQSLKKEKENILQNFQDYEVRRKTIEEQGKVVRKDFDLVEEKWENHDKIQKELQEKIQPILKKTDYTEIRDLHAGKLPPDVLSQWQEQIKTAQNDFSEIKQKYEEHKGKVANLSSAEEDLAATQSRIEHLRNIWQRFLEDKGRIQQTIEYQEKLLQESAKIQERWKALQQEEELYRQISLDMRADRFPSYVLDYALQTLMEDGSQQLDLLSSGRYSFALEGREFCVIDHWNNDEKRPSRTLSGGETFLASLSLALALAESIYQLGSRVGATAVLESLFIDEGFGNLDEEHLDVVVKALTNLQGSGRTIGIISHLPLLNNYLPMRLNIVKNKESSSVEKMYNA